MQERGLQPAVIGGAALEAVAFAEQLGQRAGPFRRLRPQPGGGQRGQLPGQPVEFDLRGVDAGLVQPGIGLGGEQQAEQREVGALLARRLREPLPAAGGLVHMCLVPTRSGGLARAYAGARQ